MTTKISNHLCYIALFPIAFADFSVSCAHAQVIPAGTTPTTATVAPGGRVTVGIAPASVNGISHNAYTQFSVPTQGVGLNNNGVNATTIVNEVTSTSRSIIRGPIEVLGSRAHVIIANPNGITVDGGSFVNTGGATLSGGRVRYETTGSGGVNAVVGSGSDILIGPGGLSGNLSSLQLIAGRLKIEGAIRNENASPNADIALTAGNAEIEHDSTVIPGSTLRPWAVRRDLGGNSNEILIDVTPSGSLSASRVKLAVSSRGAGVSFAGSGQASVGEFLISSTGHVLVSGAKIAAERSIKVQALSIAVLNREQRQSSIESLTGGVALLARGGDIDIRGQITGASRDASDFDQKGAATLSSTGSINLLTEAKDRLAIVFASGGDLALNADGNFTNNTGRLLANSNVLMTVRGRLNNTIDVIDAGSGPVTTPLLGQQKRSWISFFKRPKQTLTISENFGQFRLPGEMAYIAGKAVFLTADHIVNSGEMSALDGVLQINARKVDVVGQRSGTIEFHKTCGVVCTSTGKAITSHAGGQINAASSLFITASQSIQNDGGQLLSYGDIELNAPAISSNALFSPTLVSRPSGLGSFFSGPKAWLSQQPVGGTILAPIGQVSLQTGERVQLSGGVVQGRNGVINPMGIIEIVPAQPQTPVGKQHIGFFQKLLR